MISVVGVDLGIHFGVAFKDKVGENSFHSELPKEDRLDYFYSIISNLHNTYNPTAFTYGKPHVFGKCRYNVIALHLKLAAMIELFCERRNIYCIPIGDSEARKIVFDKKITKKEAHKETGIKSADEADALILCRAMYIKIKNENPEM